jgi:hypothetical protein
MRRALYGLILAIFALAWSGCIFQPRDPEDPGGTVITYLPQSEPRNVIANIEKAMENLDPAGYDRQIAEDFVYEPDSGTEASYPGIDWAAWGREQEVEFMNAFLGGGSVTGVTSDMRAVELDTDWSGSEAFLRYTYSIVVDESGSQVPYRATVSLDFRLDGTFWVLYRWFDEQGEQDPDSGANLPSLGQRRGAFAAAGGG